MFRSIAKVSTSIKQLTERLYIITGTGVTQPSPRVQIFRKFKEYQRYYNMEKLWKDLPYDLVRLVLSFADDIDVRIYFGILPRKLKIDQNFNFRNEYVYDTESMTLRQFVWHGGTGAHSVRRGIKFDQIRETLHVFNMGWDEYEIEVITPEFKLGPITSREHVVINKQIKFR